MINQQGCTMLLSPAQSKIKCHTPLPSDRVHNCHAAPPAQIKYKKPSSSRHNALFVTTFCSQERADLPHSRGMHHPFRLRGVECSHPKAFLTDCWNIGGHPKVTKFACIFLRHKRWMSSYSIPLQKGILCVLLIGSPRGKTQVPFISIFFPSI